MIETFVLDNFDNISRKMSGEDKVFKPKLSLPNIIISLIVSLGAAYFAYKCNEKENEATRLVYVLIAFLFPGLYLIYFFIRYSILGGKCGGVDLTKLLAKKR